MYIGGLTRALNELNVRLESHPLIATLQARLAASEAATAESNQALQRMLSVEVPRHTEAAVRAETARMERKVAQAVSERDLMQRDLEKEAVAHRAFRRAAIEREAALDARLADERRRTELARADVADIQQRLDERNRQLQILRAKVS